MDSNQNERFTFFRSFEAAYDKLKTLEEKHEFIKMVMRMGFDGVEPEPSESMPYILYDVGAREKLVKGREIRAKRALVGHRGGIVTGETKARHGNKNAAKHTRPIDVCY